MRARVHALLSPKLKLKFSLNQVTYSEKVMMDFDGDSNIVVKVIESPGWWKPDTMKM